MNWKQQTSTFVSQLDALPLIVRKCDQFFTCGLRSLQSPVWFSQLNRLHHPQRDCQVPLSSRCERFEAILKAWCSSIVNVFMLECCLSRECFVINAWENVPLSVITDLSFYRMTLVTDHIPSISEECLGELLDDGLHNYVIFPPFLALAEVTDMYKEALGQHGKMVGDGVEVKTSQIVGGGRGLFTTIDFQAGAIITGKLLLWALYTINYFICQCFLLSDWCNLF